MKLYIFLFDYINILHEKYVLNIAFVLKSFIKAALYI